MRAFWYGLIIKVVVLVTYSLILLGIVSLSQDIRMKDVLASSDSSTMDAEIDICYPLRLSKQYCHDLDDPIKEKPKVKPTECKEHMPLGCCTQNLKKPSEIIGAFKENISDLVRISSENGEDLPQKSYQIQFDQICVKYQFKNLNHTDDNIRSTSFEIQSSESNYQTFDIHFSFVRKYSNGTEYVAGRQYLISRNCWKTENEKCLETHKNVTIEVEYLSVRYKKKPFVTHCKETNETPEECYENCVKKEKSNYYLMSYNESDQMELDFNVYDYKRCWRACSRPNCFTAAFHIEGIDEKAISIPAAPKGSNPSKGSSNPKTPSNPRIPSNPKVSNPPKISTTPKPETSTTQENPVKKFKKFPGTIHLTAMSSAFGIDATPVLSRSRFIWMISVSVAVFMGLDCYGIFVRTTKIYRKSGNQKKNPKRSQVQVFFALFIFSASLTLAILCEKSLFHFGADLNPNNETRLIEIRSVTERSVSISVCFDLCKIWKTKDACNELLLGKMPLKELESKTLNSLWFRSIASLKNNVKFVPIRQKEKIIPAFYRNMKKCFLVSHEASTILPHLSLQRKAIIHLTLQPGTNPKTPNYTHFYLADGDGLAFPDIKANPGRKSVMHYVQIHYEDGACNHTNSNETKNAYFVTRDDLVQRCIVEKFAEQHKKLPPFVNFKIVEKLDEKYLEMPFDTRVPRETELEWIERCEQEVTEKRCIKTVTTLSRFELQQERLGNKSVEDKNGQYIVVSLTPILLEKRPYQRENYLIIFNRLISFLMLFTCYSVVSGHSNH